MNRGISVSLSSVTDPPGPESVMLARRTAQPGSTGRTKAKDDLPSPSVTSGMAKPTEKSSSPLPLRPVIRFSPVALGSLEGASTTKDGLRKSWPSASIPPHRRRDSAS